MLNTLVLYRAGVLVLAGIIAGGAHSALREKPLALQPAEPAPVIVVPVPQHTSVPAGAGAATVTAPKPLGLEISVPQALELFDKGVSFVDARHLPEYEAGHVDGALLLSAESFLGGSVPDALNYLDPQAQVVVYCGGGQCDASKNLVILLQQAGFTRAHIMTDGYPAWVAAGHPIATGKPVGP